MHKSFHYFVVTLTFLPFSCTLIYITVSKYACTYLKTYPFSLSSNSKSAEKQVHFVFLSNPVLPFFYLSLCRL